MKTIEKIKHLLKRAYGEQAEKCKLYGVGEAVEQLENEYAALKSAESALRKIMNAHNSKNNGAYMGEANEAINQIDSIRGDK